MIKILNVFLIGVFYLMTGYGAKYHSVNGATIFAESLGRGPTVVFESGLGDDSRTWSSIVTEVSKFAHVIVYDRAGLGKSKASGVNEMRTAKDVCSDLKGLLSIYQLKQPIILVGHSLGGLYAQYFARNYPELVAGVLLIDAVSPDQVEHDPLPEEKNAIYYEGIGIAESKAQVIASPKYPQVPVMVLTAIRDDSTTLTRESNTRILLHSKLAAMSDNSQHIVSFKTGHYIHQEKPWLVIAAIKELIKNG